MERGFPQDPGRTTVKINTRMPLSGSSGPRQSRAAPDDTATGTVSVVLTTANGSATGSWSWGSSSPFLQSARCAATWRAIITGEDGSGAFGSGENSYDIIGPTGTTLGTRRGRSKRATTYRVFGVGFGPTNPPVPAGQVFSGRGSHDQRLS